MAQWFVYLLECADGTLYAGITTDLLRREKTHNLGKGARYTASRRPVKLVYSEPAIDRGQATARELALKRMPRARKLELASKPEPPCVGK